MGRPGCEQCCGKPEPAQCLSCLHACQYAEVNDPALLDKYWDGKVYQPTGFEGDPNGILGQLGSTFGYNASRAYSNFDPEIHPCNQDKFEYIVLVSNCQTMCIPNGDFDVCINGENLGTYIGYDPINPQDIPLFQGLPLFPYSSLYNDPRRCGSADYKSTIFGTSQEAIDHVVDTNFGFGWFERQPFGNPILIPPAERKTLADYNTSVVPKDPFLMDARDIIIDQSGNPSFGPKGGSFDLKLIPNPGINNLRLDTLDRSKFMGKPINQLRVELLQCYKQMGTIDPNDIPDFEDVYNGLDPYPIQWTPPSKVSVVIYSLERPVGNDNVTEFRVCKVAAACLCVPKEEEACINFGYRPLCVNPFDSDNYENGQPKFISSEDYDASVACTCNDDEEYEEPQSPGDPNAAPTCYYDVDIYIDSPLTISGTSLNRAAQGDWKDATKQIMQEYVDAAFDGQISGTFAVPLDPGYGVRIAQGLKDKVDDALSLTDGCPRTLEVAGYVGPFRFSPFANLFAEGENSRWVYGSLLREGVGNHNDVYYRVTTAFHYNAYAISDALASDIPDGNGGLKFSGTCCARWVTDDSFGPPGPNVPPVRGLRPKYVIVSNMWSTALGPLINTNPHTGFISTGGTNPTSFLSPVAGFGGCDNEAVGGGDEMPLYLEVDNAFASSAPFAGNPTQFCPQGVPLGGCLVPTIRAIPSDCPNGVDQNLLPPLSVWQSNLEKQYYGEFGTILDCAPGKGGLTPNGFPHLAWMGREVRRIEPFWGGSDDGPIVYTLNDLSSAKYYYNLDGGCAGRNCGRPIPLDKLDPCLGCSQGLNTSGEFNTTFDMCTCPDDFDPCSQPDTCPPFENGYCEVVLDPDGNPIVRLGCDPNYVLKVDDNGCRQCVRPDCNANFSFCQYSWNGNGWQIAFRTCPCKCEPPNIPGTFVGELALGSCVDDFGNRVCGEGKCWWTWFVLVGGGGEWRKNAADDPFGFPTTCECRCDPPPNDGNFAGDQTATTCFE